MSKLKKLGGDSMFTKKDILAMASEYDEVSAKIKELESRKKVLADKNFPQYHGKYPQAKEDIPRNTYIGPSVYVAPKKQSAPESESESED